MESRKRSLGDDDLPESPMASRTRPRLEIEPLELGMQLASSNPPSPPSPPSPPQSLDGNLDLNIPTDLTLCLYFNSSPVLKQPQFPPQSPPTPHEYQDSNILTDLNLCVYFPPSAPATEQPQSPPQSPPPQPDNRQELPPVDQVHVPQPVVAPVVRRQRKNPTHAPRQGKPPTIQPPFPWATDRRAQVHSLKYLIERGITTISGDVQCKRCDQHYQIEYNLEQRFAEVSRYVAENKYSFRERAPAVWMSPTLPKCRYCNQENSVKPRMAEKKKLVNWLFLLLGQMIGCCTLDQLKYFCKHTGAHRTGAKDRVLFLTYLGLCKQVDPDGPFDR